MYLIQLNTVHIQFEGQYAAPCSAKHWLFAGLMLGNRIIIKDPID